MSAQPQPTPTRASAVDWRSMEVRAASAFAGDQVDGDVASFLAELRTNRREIAAQERRVYWLVVLLLAVLFLIDRGQVTGGGVMFVQLESLSLVGLAIPPAVGYLLVNQYLLLLDENYASALHDEILRLRQPAVSQQSLELMLAPPTSSWYQGGKVALLYGRQGRRSEVLGVTIGVFTTTLPLIMSQVVVAFLLYELVHLYGWTYPGTWIAGAIVIGEWVFLGLLARETQLPWTGPKDDGDAARGSGQQD